MDVLDPNAPPPAAPGAAPSDAEIKKARVKEKALRNLEKAHKARTEKAAARREAREQDDSDAKAIEKLNPATLHAGCRALVRFCYFLATFGAWVSGGKLQDLTDSEIDEGAKEATELVQRFVWLARLLAFVGFPLWLARKVAEKFERKEALPKSPPQLAAVPKAGTP